MKRKGYRYLLKLSSTERFQLVNGHSSGSFSLFILRLTKEDEGVYTCRYQNRKRLNTETLDLLLMVNV